MKKIILAISIIIGVIGIMMTAVALAEAHGYYIDYENGSDSNLGTKESPWKHHPWDPEAVDIAKAHIGVCNYYFKKGVIYRGGNLSVKESGAIDSPIVLGVDSDWGVGEAQIYGSERITGGWKKCTEGDCPEILAGERDKVWYVDTAFDYVYIPMMLYEIRDGRIIKLNIARSPNWNIPIPESPQDYALDDPKTVWWEFTGYGFQSKLTLDSVSGFNVGDQVYKVGYTAGWEKGVVKIYEVGADYIKVRAEQAAKEDFFSADQITNGSITHTINAVSRLPTKYRDNANLTQSDPNFYKDGVVWYEDYCFWPRAARVQNYDPVNHEIEFYCVRDQYINKKFYRYFIEGLPQLLDAGNEWCYIRAKDSPHRGRIYLRLEGDRDPNTTIIEKAKYHTFLNIENKNNIVVDGVQIKFFNAREFYADPDDYPNYSYYPYYPKLVNTDETRLHDGSRSRAAEYFSPVIRITRNSSNIAVNNCRIEYSNVGIAIFPDGKDKLLDNIKISHNRIAHMEANAIVTLLGENFGEIQWIWDWWPIKQGKPYAVLNSRIKHIQIKNNQIENIGLRAQSWNPSGAVGLYDIENSEIAYNTVDYSAVPGILVDSPSEYWGDKGTWTCGSDKMDYPLQRNLIHHNQVSRGCLMTEDMGGIETWHAGTNYVYSNISGNHTGSRYPYKKQNPTSKDYYRIGAFSPGLYIDNGFKNYVFNNIFWGKNNNENDFIYNSVGYFDYNAIQNTVFNNTIYNCAVGIHKGGEQDNRSYYLNNLIINTYERYIRDTVTERSQLDSIGYADNIFNGQIKPLFGELQLVPLSTRADFVNFLIQKKSICVDPGQEVSAQQVIDAPSLDFHLLDNSAAVDKAKKVFVPWGLYAVVGEWNFYKYPADINRVLDEHFYWNKEWVSLPVVQATPPLRYDLFSYNTNESNFKMGALENWIESAFELDGDKQYLGCSADKCGLLDMDKDADGNPKINNFLIEAVLKINSNENQGGIVEKSDGSRGYSLSLVNGYLKMTVKLGASDCSRTSVSSLNDGKWHHIIAEVDRGNQEGINIYVDGKLCNGLFSGTMDSSSNISNSGNFIIGHSAEDGYLAATFDFLRISRGTLAQAETTIEELYDWEFNGPFLKDFYGSSISGNARDIGAVEFVVLKANAGMDQTVNKGNEVSFDAGESTGEIVNYNWDFGDGQTGQGVKIVHRYARPGTYQVTLTITDDQGNTSIDTLKVIVTDEIIFREAGTISFAGTARSTSGISAFKRNGKNYVAVPLSADGLKIYDVTDPSSPVLKYSYDDNRTPMSIFHSQSIYNAVSDCLYSAGREGGLYIFDLSNSSTGHALENGNMNVNDMINRILPPNDGVEPKVTGMYLDAVNDIMYAANRTGGWFAVLNPISSPAACTASTAIKDISSTEIHHLVKSGDYLYCPVSTGFEIHDISAPEKHKKLVQMFQHSIPWDVKIRDNYAYYVVWDINSRGAFYHYNPALYVVDITNKYSPEIISKWIYPGPYPAYPSPYDPPPYFFELAGNYAIIPWERNGTVILDVTKPWDISKNTVIPVPAVSGATKEFGSRGVAVLDNYIYVIYGDQATYNVMVKIYEVQSCDLNQTGQINKTKLINHWHQAGTSDNLVDDDFSQGTTDYYDGDKVWHGIIKAIPAVDETESVVTKNGQAQYKILPGGTIIELARSIQPQNEYHLQFALNINELPVGIGGSFYIYLLQYDPMDTTQTTKPRLYLIGQKRSDTTYRLYLRYYHTNSLYTDTSVSADLNLGADYKIDVIYKINTLSENNIVFSINDAQVDSDNTDTSGVTLRPSLITLGISTVSSTAAYIVNIDGFHYNNTEIDSNTDTLNLWVTNLPDDVNPDVLWCNGIAGVKKDSLQLCVLNGDFFYDSASTPRKLYLYYDGGDPDFHLPVTMQKLICNGDINGDGEVNVLDLQSCVNVVLGIIEDPEKKADVNGDKEVNVLDVQRIVNLILLGE